MMGSFRRGVFAAGVFRGRPRGDIRASRHQSIDTGRPQVPDNRYLFVQDGCAITISCHRISVACMQLTRLGTLINPEESLYETQNIADYTLSRRK